MNTNLIDKKYLNMSSQDLLILIQDLKNKLGSNLVIPVHHYQGIDIVRFNDFVGDSYKLAVECSRTNAKYIVFCGVLFMAEVASIMAGTDVHVLLPEPTAGCPMAEMADLNLVNKAYELIEKNCKRQIAPVVYMNSYADLKSFCGEKDGSVCTSSNAAKIMTHFFDKNKSILFFPDYYLGKNTAKTLGINENQIVKVKKNLTLETTGNISNAKLFLWDGFCPVHQRFNAGDIRNLKTKYADIKIISHPECTEEVAALSDVIGSTEIIYKTITNSPEGSTWGVGTEATFVHRLAYENKNKTIIPLRESVCKNMIKVTLPYLASSLQSIIDFENTNGKLRFEVKVEEDYKINAKKALNNMIKIVENI